MEESGVPAAQADGVTSMGTADGTAVFDVGSGTYHFTAAPPAATSPGGGDAGTGDGGTGGAGGSNPGTGGNGGGPTDGGTPGRPTDSGGSTGGSPAGQGPNGSARGGGGGTATRRPTKKPAPAPTLAKLKLTTTAVAHARLVLKITCTAHCTAKAAKLRIVISALTGRHTIFAHSSVRLTHGHDRTELRLPARDRLGGRRVRITITGPGDKPLTTTVRVRR